jgi:asparagine N-glycosylation enzyme membrane subunit Stt3
VILGIVLRLHGWRAVDADVEWLFEWFSRMTAPIAAAASVATLCLGVAYGTFSAGGSDPYGYVSEADLWLNHQVRIAQPFVGELPIANADRAFAPLAYRPVGSDHVIVPTYPAGLPLLMAAAKLVAGPRAVYAVVPILGALTIWLCYLLGARAASPIVGCMAAIGLAASPAFLFILMPPMSDIPATAFWTATIVFSLGSRKYFPLVAGICCAMAIVIRPNLAPLAIVPCAYLMWTRGGWRSFVIGLLPGVLLVAAINDRLYGSPFMSGYGDVGNLYAWRNAPVNLRRYSGWLLETQTPLVFFAILSLVKRPRGVHVLLVCLTLTSKWQCCSLILILRN